MALAGNAAAAPSAADPPTAQTAHGGAVRIQAGKPTRVPTVAPPQGARPAKEEPKAAAAAPNAAYRQYTVWYGPVTIQPNEWWTAWVSCPSGMVATGGGESNTSAGGVVLHNTAALDDGSGWQVTVTTDGATSATFKVFAVCFSGLNAYLHMSDKALVGAGSGTTLVTNCPTTVYQLLGGGGSSDTLNTGINASPIAGTRSWVFGMSNYDSAAHTANSQAVCGMGVNNYQAVNGPENTLAPGQIGSSFVSCPPGTWIVGGGGFGGGILTDSYPDGQGWRAYILNNTPYTGYAAARAICGN